MKILLQNIRTGLYVSHGNTWNAEPEEALAFSDFSGAKAHGANHRLSQVRLVVLAGRGASQRSAESQMAEPC